MHLDLLKAIPDELRDRLDDEYALLLKVRPAEINAMWPRCWKIISFYTQDDLIIQGCKQYLSHHQCVISTLLFGLSLSPYHSNSGPVVSRDAAAFYLNSGISAIHLNKHELDLSWLTSRHVNLWLVICKNYLAFNQDEANFDKHFVAFADSQLGRLTKIA